MINSTEHQLRAECNCCAVCRSPQGTFSLAGLDLERRPNSSHIQKIEMRRLVIIALASASLTATAPLAVAQDWRSTDRRQARLDERIDGGVRNGSLTRAEAARLRAEYRDIARLETRYRRNDLSSWERADLDRRYDNLSVRIRDQRHDDQLRQRHAMPINQRQANISRRIAAGVRDRQISWSEARQLHSDYDDITRIEVRFRRNGLQPSERRYLSMRLDNLSRRVNNYRHDEDFLWF